jgi:hypothetical protein
MRLHTMSVIMSCWSCLRWALSFGALLEAAKDDGNFIESGFVSGWVEYDSKERREIL